jgi:hypothetical protein
LESFGLPTGFSRSYPLLPDPQLLYSVSPIPAGSPASHAV